MLLVWVYFPEHNWILVIFWKESYFIVFFWRCKFCEELLWSSQRDDFDLCLKEPIDAWISLSLSDLLKRLGFQIWLWSACISASAFKPSPLASSSSKNVSSTIHIEKMNLPANLRRNPTLHQREPTALSPPIFWIACFKVCSQIRLIFKSFSRATF